MSKHKLLNTFIFTFLFLTAGGIVLADAVSAARFYFDPPTSALSTSCSTFTTSVMIDTELQPVNAADIEITYNPAQVTLVDYNTIATGTQIGIGNAFESYRGNLVSGSSIRLIGSSFSQNLTGVAKFAEIKFTRGVGINSTAFSIRYDGAGVTTDSNIAHASTNQDLLSSVTNATYTFSPSACPEVIASDSVPPVITLEQPVNKSTGVAVDSNVVLRLRDTASGVRSSSISIKVDGITYTASSPEVSVTGTPADYTVTIDPAVSLPSNKLINIEVSVSDENNNTTLEVFSFNDTTAAPVGDLSAPTISMLSPLPGAKGVALDTNIHVRLRDAGSGIDISKLQITIAGIDYAYNEATVVVSGTAAEYDVFVNPIQNLPAAIPITVEVFVADVAGNNSSASFNFNELEVAVVSPPAPSNPAQVIIQGLFTPPEKPFEGTFLADTPVEKFVEETGAVGASNVIITTLLLFNLLSFVNILTTPALLAGMLGFIFKRKRDKTWGVIFDAQTNKPVAFAVTRLYISGTKSLVEQKVSDTSGRYGFVVAAGNYRLEVTHSDYGTASKELVITEENPTYNLDVKLIPRAMYVETQDSSIFDRFGMAFRKFIRGISPYLFLAGFLLSLISVTLTPSLFNLTLLVIYTVLLLSLLLGRLTSRSKSASVIDADTGLRIPGAIIRIYSDKNMELVDSQITNFLGKFNFWGEPGNYWVLVSARGYKFPSRRQKEGEGERNDNKGMVKINFKRNSQVTLFVDPIASMADSQTLASSIEVKRLKGNSGQMHLQTPFG